jgi:hypothetical protein
MVAILQLLHADVTPDRDIAQELKLRRLGYPLIYPYGFFEFRVVRRDTTAHEPERRGKTFEHVDKNERFRSDQRLGGVKAAWPTANNRYPHRIFLCAEVTHAA